MTHEEMNRACAKLCGWKSVPDPHDKYNNIWERGTLGNDDWDMCDSLPDYCTDRNAIAELEEAIEAKGKAWEYMHELHLLVDPECGQIGHAKGWLFRTATPRQCVEACLRAFGLWEE